MTRMATTSLATTSMATTGMAEPLLAVRDLRAGYGELIVLDGVALDLAEGGSLAVLGRNGVGKTTLLATLMGCTSVHAGAILWRGRDITRLAPYRRARLGIGWVAQEREIFPSLTVEENLTVAARPARRLADRNEYRSGPGNERPNGRLTERASEAADPRPNQRADAGANEPADGRRNEHADASRNNQFADAVATNLPTHIATNLPTHIAMNLLMHIAMNLLMHIAMNAPPNFRRAMDAGHRLRTVPRLAERRRNSGTHLSGGEQQMLAIARALMTNPALLLLDEPLEGLAPIIVEELTGAIAGMIARQGTAVILVEQHAQIALSLTREVVVLERRISPSRQSRPR